MAYNGDGVKAVTMSTDDLFHRFVSTTKTVHVSNFSYSSVEHFQDFFWESHTFTHPNLTGLDYILLKFTNPSDFCLT